jgi:nicotinamide-nucleotide amidase
VLAVGTELLLGQIVDSNSAWIGGELAANGIDSLVQVKVGDNVARIEHQLRRLLADARAVVVCGGLGPTHDDVTRDAIAAVMGVDLVLDEGVADTIRALFAARDRPMAENNLRQAMVPVGATVIAQTRGTAPGLICPIDGAGDARDGRVIYAVPGVPHEMMDMVHRAVIPDLAARAGTSEVIVSRVIRTWGDSESGLAARLEGMIASLDAPPTPDAPTLAFLASGWEGLKVRLTTKAPSEAVARERLAQWETLVRAELGDLVFGVDDDTMESVVLGQCRERGWTLGLAESVTGGLVGARLTAIPGASDVLRGSIVSYATAIKRSVLDVAAPSVVSAEAAREMAHGARRVLDSDVGLALTGVAGPTEQDGQPVGTLFVGMVGPGFDEVHHVRLPGQREQMRQFAVISSLGLLRTAIEEAT